MRRASDRLPGQVQRQADEDVRQGKHDVKEGRRHQASGEGERLDVQGVKDSGDLGTVEASVRRTTAWVDLWE